MTTNSKPDLIAYAVEGEGEKVFWTRIGAAWLQKSGVGYNIQLKALPLHARIVLSPPRVPEDAVGS